MALFGPSAGARREPRSLVEFRAGKMTLRNRTVTPDKRKGLVFMKMDDGQLLHFCWKDRTSGLVEDDYILFPGDADMKFVPQCTTGRVLLLHFKNNNRRLFFWMQEPKEDRDEEYCKTVNDLIANPHSADAAGGDISGLHAGLMGMDGHSLQALLEGMDRQQIMELLNQGTLPFGSLAGLAGSSSSSRPSTGNQSRPDTAVTSQSQEPVSQSGGGRRTSGTSRSEQQHSESSQPSQPRVGLSDLQSILSTLIPPGTDVTATDGGSQGAAGGTPQINLTDAITPDALRRVGGDAECSSQLRDHLPPSGEGVVPILTSPQFRQSLDVFGAALESGQLGPLMMQFGLQAQTAQAAATGSVQSFARALQGEMSGEASAKGGAEVKGDNPKDDQSGGDKPNNDKSEGDKPEDEKSGGDKREDDKSGSDKRDDDKSGSDKREDDKSGGDNMKMDK